MFTTKEEIIMGEEETKETTEPTELKEESTLEGDGKCDCGGCDKDCCK